VHGLFWLNWVFKQLQLVHAWNLRFRFRFMVFNATFNNISVISWRSVLFVEEKVPGENHRPVVSHWQTFLHNVVLSTPCLSGVRTHYCSWMKFKDDYLLRFYEFTCICIFFYYLLGCGFQYWTRDGYGTCSVAQQLYRQSDDSIMARRWNDSLE